MTTVAAPSIELLDFDADVPCDAYMCDRSASLIVIPVCEHWRVPICAPCWNAITVTDEPAFCTDCGAPDEPPRTWMRVEPLKGNAP